MTPAPGPLTLPVLDAVTARRGGDRLVIAHRPSVPLIQLRALLHGPGGAAARVAAACLLRRPAALERLDAVGATAEVFSRPDGILLSASAEPGEAEAVVALLLELLRPAVEPAAAVMSAEAARLAAADAVAARDPAELTRRAALRSAFGPASPYSDALAEDLRQVAPAEVQQWHAAAGDVVLVVCGAVDPAADWGDGGGTATRPTPVRVDGPAARPRWKVADRPGSAQTTLRAVAPFPPPGTAGRAAAEVVDRLLGGGGKGSRLVRELRERRGYGYHPGTTVVDLTHASYLLLEVDVATEVTGDAVRVVDDVLASLHEDPPDAREIELAHRGVIGDLARATDAQGSLAELLLTHAVAGSEPGTVTSVAADVAGVDAGAVVATSTSLVAGMHGAAAADTAAMRDQQLPRTWSSGA